MESDKKIKILTHDGKFHADEVFAIAILKELYDNIEIVRSRNLKDIEEFDFVVDVGGMYDVNKKIFDHHQKDFNEKRENGIPYSSCGLIWKHYGRKLVNSDNAFEAIDKNLFQFIDANDNGIKCYDGDVRIYSISNLIGSFNAGWNSEKNDDELFLEALDLAYGVLNRELNSVNSILEGEKLVEECLSKTDKEFVILPKPGLPKGPIIDSENTKFFIFPAGENHWVSMAVPVEGGSFVRRKYFPKAWAGLNGEEMEKVSGVKGAKFCHKDKFIIAAKTEESIIELTKKALVLE